MFTKNSTGQNLFQYLNSNIKFPLKIQQILHTRNKKFTTLHPNSYFANHCEVIQPSDYDITEGRRKEKSASHKHQLITYTSLLETKKPYLCNTMRVGHFSFIKKILVKFELVFLFVHKIMFV